MNYDEPDQPQKKEKTDFVIDKFIDDYYFTNSRQSKNFASALVGDNIIYAISKKGKKYYFLKTDTDNFTKYKNGNDMTFEYIEFDTDYFKKNEQNFIKSIKEKNIIGSDNIKVKQGKNSDFEKFTTKNFINDGLSEILDIYPKEIPDIQPLPVQEKKVLMGDDDEEEEEEEEESRMVDEDDEEEERKRKMKKDDKEEKILNANDFEKIIKEEYKKKQKDDFEDNQVFLADEYDKEKEYSDDERELFKQAKKMKDRKLKKQIEEYNKKFHPEQEKQQKKQRSGVMKEEDRDVFDQLTGDLGFTKVKGPDAKAYLRVGDDVIFIRKVPEKKKDSKIFKNDPYLAVKLNEEDFRKMYNGKNTKDIQAEFFNFNTDYFNKNKYKFREAIKEGEFAFDDYIKEAKERLIKAGIQSNIGDKFTYEQIKEYGILPGKKKFDYVKMFDLKNGNITEEKINNGEQLIKFSKDGKNITVNLPSKYLSNGYPDSLLKLIVGVSENNKGEIDFKEIGEIQDLNGDITNLYSKMQELKSKINSSKNEEEKERLLIKYNEKRLKLEDLIKKYSKEAYRLSTLNKKKKATYSNPNYIKNKLSKLK